MSDLPNWVYDVVMALEKWSFEHPKLYAQYGGSNEWQTVPGCCDPLELVPAEVRDWARAIAAYVKRAEQGRELDRVVMAPDAE